MVCPQGLVNTILICLHTPQLLKGMARWYKKARKWQSPHCMYQNIWYMQLGWRTRLTGPSTPTHYFVEFCRNRRPTSPKMMELPFVLSVYHFWMGLSPFLNLVQPLLLIIVKRKCFNFNESSSGLHWRQVHQGQVWSNIEFSAEFFWRERCYVAHCREFKFKKEIDECNKFLTNYICQHSTTSARINYVSTISNSFSSVSTSASTSTISNSTSASTISNSTSTSIASISPLPSSAPYHLLWQEEQFNRAEVFQDFSRWYVVVQTRYQFLILKAGLAKVLKKMRVEIIQK